jgi:inner membrane transporter RhtA
MGRVESGALTGAAHGGRAALGRLPAPALLIAAAFSVQSGAALATTLFDEIGPIGTVFLRTAFAAVVLALLLRAGGRRGRGGPWRWPILLGLTYAIAISTALVAPFGIAAGGLELVEPHLLALGLAVAVLATVIPYVLELAALRRLKTSTFGILMSLGPAVAALAGAIFLSQHLGPVELLAVACVVVASIGANRGAQAAVAPEA